MKKSIYIIIITLITLVCIVIGCFRFVFNAGQKVFDYITNDTTEESSLSSKNTQTVDDFTSIKIDVDVLDVNIVTGDSYSIAYDGNEKLEPSFKVQKGVLVVTQKGQSWKSFSFDNNKCEAVITVPENTTLDSLDISSDVGDIDISGVTSKTTSINADVGDATINKSNLGSAEFTLDTGDVEMDNSQFDMLTIKADVGDVEIDSATDLSNYNMDISTSVGDIEINGKNYENNYNTNSSGKNKLSIDNSTGDIDITY